MQTEVMKGWLDISEEGFALENAGREPAHLAKELVQNALDAIDSTTAEEGGGRVAIDISFVNGSVILTVTDNGPGITPENLRTIRTVFWTSKRDLPTKRGRMGRGFKEPLSMASSACVHSGSHILLFTTTGAGERLTSLEEAGTHQTGTRVSMTLNWPESEVVKLRNYFRRFVAPVGTVITLNGEKLPRRLPVHTIDCKLTTELFVEGNWRKEKRKTQAELLATLPGEEPTIFEMGIPVCPLGWDQPYHANVLQRVPMNPKRDMVLPGYPQQIHKAALPVLLDAMTSEEVMTDWVGAVAEQVPEETQKAIISKGLGDNVVRSVPTMGGSRRDFDADASEELGVKTINTRQLPGGLGEIVKQHVPTSRQVVEQHRSTLRVDAARAVVTADPDAADKRQATVNARLSELGGKDRVRRVMDWAGWFSQKLLEQYPDPPLVQVRMALYCVDQPSRIAPWATWSERDELTLALDHPDIWRNPFGPNALRTFIHEAAHHRNSHHGGRFSEEVELLAGRAAWVMFHQHDEIRTRFGDLLG